MTLWQKHLVLEYCCLLGFIPSWHLYYTRNIPVCRDEYQIVFKSMWQFLKKVQSSLSLQIYSSLFVFVFQNSVVIGILSMCLGVIAKELVKWTKKEIQNPWLCFVLKYQCCVQPAFEMYCLQADKNAFQLKEVSGSHQEVMWPGFNPCIAWLACHSSPLLMESHGCEVKYQASQIFCWETCFKFSFNII